MNGLLGGKKHATMFRGIKSKNCNNYTLIKGFFVTKEFTFRVGSCCSNRTKSDKGRGKINKVVRT